MDSVLTVLLAGGKGLGTGTYRARAASAGFDHFRGQPGDPNVITDLLRGISARLSPDDDRAGAQPPR